MKQRLLSLVAMATISLSTFGQAPEGFKYQAVVRDAGNTILNNQAVGMRMTIQQGSIGGTSVYQETFAPTTNAFGLVNLEIGSGSVVSGDFTTIDWANGPFFIETAVDITGGTSYSVMGTSQLMSVPYALYAKTSGNGAGPIGPQGPAGNDGAVGATGPQGPAGNDGNGFTNGTVANQMMYWNGNAWVTLNPGVDGQVLAICNGSLGWTTLAGVCPVSPPYPVGTVHCGGTPTAVVDVTNPITGKIWMDRNLGASQVATSSTDASAYGDLYQWGRGADGHQCRNSTDVTTTSSTDQPGHDDFIVYSNVPADWRSPQNDNLWQGVNGINNPCPSGYRIPTIAEITAEKSSWISNDAIGAFNSPLKLTKGGSRNFSVVAAGAVGELQSSSVSSTGSFFIDFDDSWSTIVTGPRFSGRTVRCIKDVPVSVGSIGNLDCNGATLAGSLTEGTPASGVSSEVTYTGGNGGSHTGQTVTSTGVTGLTATLVAGNFATGSGTLTYTITGTPNASGTASFALNIGGQTCSLAISVSPATPQYPVGTLHCGGTPTAIVDVTNPTTGKTWMDRNLGASQVATSSTDASAYGDIYQWGRAADGHQCRTSPTTTTLSSTDQPGHSDFIFPPNVSPWDWRSPQNGNLWQGVNGVNNPCPTGYRLPTEIELNDERNSWSSNDAAGAFSSPLKLTMGGIRDINAQLFLVDSYGYYWSSTANTFVTSRYFHFNTSVGYMNPGQRSQAASVRCIKD